MARVLVVDDDDSIREMLTHLLQLNGHEPVPAVDGPEALSKLREQKFDLVILDRAMPRLSGIDVLKLVRASPGLKTLKILMLTSASVTREVDEAFEAGASGYILKPIDMASLIGKIEAALKPNKK